MTTSKVLPALPLLAPALVAGTIATPAAAATVSVTIPRINVAEYHRPYVVGWLEPAAGGPARTVFVWYDVKKAGREPGTKWLADLRTWWRKGGRSLNLPADGLSGATRAPGTYQIPLPANLPAGQYVFKVEAARETGGRELVSVPVTVPVKKAGSASGSSELGAITIR
ncbi:MULTISPECIES: DUF2271 domain-containing protein [Novosphingobium]|uniref:DUF2271 domain-containing protein n=1 Tax=unclassified Novosphingobium TaxID=2644732 RepID=UPI001049A470|nr:MULTISPECIES: DUF2271 domain-containing protein [unclassified Novosphingobium]TCM33720.1 hypothetical protein EDF59_11935 [Novosphingobium sp. ST904]WRT95121.1 DUF2271 domain-containing protein [Novosphingobium sp. RL4]